MQTNSRIFAIACNCFSEVGMREMIVDKFMEVTGGQLPTWSVEADNPNVLEASARGFVFMDLNADLIPEVLITDNIDAIDLLEGTPPLIVQLDPNLGAERNAVVAIQRLLTYLKETRNGTSN